MRRFVLAGVFIELALLIIGITWVHPVFGGNETTSGTTVARDFRIFGNGTGNVVNVNLEATETQQELAPGVTYHVWTFNGTAPGPVIRVHLGDTIHFTLTNNSTIGMQHSIDFHAADTPWDKNYQPVNAGDTKTFDWVAHFPGVFMYHCGVPPVLQHISNGMYGAIIVEPQQKLAPAREYVLVASEFYPAKHPTNGVFEGDYNKMLAADPTYVVFNGKADQYKDSPLVAKPGELIRLWVVDAGPTFTTAFHVIGAMFDHVYPDGNPTNVLNGVQTYNVPPGGGAMFELTIDEAGKYPFVTHAFAYTGLGSVGLISVDPNAPAAPASYPMMADPFSAGVTAVGGGGVPPSSPTASPTGASPSPTASPTGGGAACKPSGTELHVTASNLLFDTKCLAVPAGQAFTIVFENKDGGVLHNVSIYTDSSVSTQLFKGKLTTGPDTVTYKVPALDAGTYYFQCDVHPATMNGTFVVA